MVALLWDAGDVVAAIELEESWNELSGEFPFALLCGYHSASVLGDDHAAALREVCRLHSSVLRPAPGRPYPAPAEVSAYFTAQPDAVRAARQFVVDALGRWGHAGWLLEDAELVMSELATNALAHARTPFWVAARVQDSGIRLSVRDASTATPTLRDGGQLAPSGRGLRIVAALASNWGVDVDADGKTVWADLRA